MTRLLALWDSLRGSFWFVPAVGLILGFALSSTTIWIDRAWLEGEVESSWLRTTPEASRTILGALTGALVTVTGLVFSLTMVVLTQTASQYGGRLLRTFMSRPLPQITLALFLGTSIFCLRVLRDVRDADDLLFAPHLSTALAIGLFLCCLAMFLAFIHHTARMIQAPEIIRSVADDLAEAIERIYPAGVAEPPGDAPDDLSFGEQPRATVRLREIGYLQGVDEERLIDLARERECLVRLLVRPGLFVGSQTAVAEILPPSAAREDVCGELREAFILGTDRTPRQDVEAAILELVEIAVRALSPGINDPRTAITATHYLADAFVRLASRHFPSEARFVDGELRLVMPRERFDAMLAAAFGAILHYAADFGPNIEAVLEGCQRIAEAIETAADPDWYGEQHVHDEPPSDLDAKRTAVLSIIELIRHRTRSQIEGCAGDLLIGQCDELERAIRSGHARTSVGQRDSDAMATAVQAIRRDESVAIET